MATKLGNNQYFNNYYRYIIALAILFIWCLLDWFYKWSVYNQSSRIQEFKKMTDELLQVMWKLNQKEAKASSTSFNFSQSFELYGSKDWEKNCRFFWLRKTADSFVKNYSMELIKMYLKKEINDF